MRPYGIMAKRRILRGQRFCTFLLRDDGQDVAEYAIMFTIILVLVVGTVRLFGLNAKNMFSSAASSVR